MKTLLVAINAKYIHTSLAVRDLKAYSAKYSDHVEYEEYTINHLTDFILKELYKSGADVLCFSCYIWNIEMVKELVKEYKKICPSVKIILGGPEVSYDKDIMNELEQIDIIIRGEGEKTFYELQEYFVDGKRNLSQIDGITYRDGNQLIQNVNRTPLALDDIPFVYTGDFSEFDNKIIYYESTRGCPFNCQYCLSSVEKGVRYLSIERTTADLQKFLDAKVVQVKFVDRTFNCNKKHALSIWKYLSEHDNGVTNFHCEISADLLDDETIMFLNTVREGLFQLEIGVQSTNLTTIDYIERKTDFERLSNNVKSIKAGKNIHQHLDLIAGLPGESYDSFRLSFNDVYDLEPEQLQLGFLKVLAGSGLKRDTKKYGLVYREKAPYEILSTNEISYGEMLRLKMIEEMVESYYNSFRFNSSIAYIEEYFETPFDFFEALGDYWEENDYDKYSHNKIKYYEILLEFAKINTDIDINKLQEFMIYDIYSHEKSKKLPSFYNIENSLTNKYKKQIKEFYMTEENINKYLPKLKHLNSKQISRQAHIEVFSFDVKNNDVSKGETAILFYYGDKSIVSQKAKTAEISLF